MEYVIPVVVIAVAVSSIGYWFLCRRRLFVIRVRGGAAFAVRGKIPQASIADFCDVLRRHRVRRGAIYGVRRNGRIALSFSRTIPAGSRQALRNVWTMHGQNGAK